MDKIMYLLNYTGDGGTEKYVLELMSALGKKKCILVYSEEGPFLHKFKELDIPIYQVKMGGPFDIKAAKQIKRIAQKEGVKYIHAQFLRENYIGLLTSILSDKIKVVWTYHVDVPMPMHIKFFNYFMTKRNYKIIAVARIMKKELITRGINEEKITVIYNGIKAPKVHVTPQKPKNEKIMSVIGRLSPEKGHRFLFESLSKLKIENPNLEWKLNIIGDGILKKELTDLSKKLDIDSHINFKGFISNVEAEYLNSDIIILPSENEAFPFVAIEALAYGKPVISTNIGGLPEIIKHNDTGLLLNYGDIDALVNSIKLLLKDEGIANRLAKNGREFFLNNLTSDKMLEQTLSLYNLTLEDIK